MRNAAEQALSLVNLLGCAMFARKDMDLPEAKRYWRRMLQLICRSGGDDSDPAVYVIAPEGKQLHEAATLYVRLMKNRPDPDEQAPEACMADFKAWYGTVLLEAAGKQQEWEMKEPGPCAS